MCDRDRNPIQCIIPPYITERLAQSDDPQVRSRALANLTAAAGLRKERELAQAMPTLMVAMSPTRKKHRLVYSAHQTDESKLPHKNYSPHPFLENDHEEGLISK